MAELFMECEEEELEPWQKRVREVEEDDEDDDDEPIFVGEISSSKPATTYILNRVNLSSPRRGIQNGAPSRGTVTAFKSESQHYVTPASSPGALPAQSVFQTVPRPVTSSVAVQPLAVVVNVSGTSQTLQRPVAGYNTSGILFGVRQNSGVPQYQTGPAVNNTATTTKLSILLVNSESLYVLNFTETNAASSTIKNGGPFPRACPKCNIHFNLMDPLKNHMKYCCPDMVNTFFSEMVKTECLSTSKTTESEKGKLIMLVNDFYYGKDEGDLQQVQQEQKTHTTFKCISCLKVLKNNIRYLNLIICFLNYLLITYSEIAVCSYRSSAFSDVETHFRTVHENTKHLLCPFCLKVIKIGAPYMHHYMRHQKKGVYRCTKCRLQFLTCKEKMDHKTQHHRTFRKPKQLEGLPPGTKVTIRASLGSHQSGSSATSSVSTSSSTFQLSPKAKNTTTKNHNKSNTSKSRGKSKQSTSRKQNAWTNSRRKKEPTNIAFHNLRYHVGTHKCIECFSEIKDFASHFPAYVHCSLCRYNTSCSKAYVNHMMSFHSARPSKRFWIFKKHSEQLRGVTVVCLNCDFLADVSGLDNMATHLSENQTHTCQVIVEEGEYRWYFFIQYINTSCGCLLSCLWTRILPLVIQIT
uniref:Zinc finger protein 280D n=1 Tax=Serinus canaria TaxID=9135 RepID=A0A8C9KQC6_SERCA